MTDSTPYGVEDGVVVFGYRGDGAIMAPEDIRVLLLETGVGNLRYSGDTVRLEVPLGSQFGAVTGVVHYGAVALAPSYRRIRDHCWGVSSLRAGGIDLLFAMREEADGEDPGDDGAYDDDPDPEESGDTIIPCAPAEGLKPEDTGQPGLLF